MWLMLTLADNGAHCMAELVCRGSVAACKDGPSRGLGQRCAGKRSWPPESLRNGKTQDLTDY